MIAGQIFLTRLAAIVGHNHILQGDQLYGIASSFWDPTQLQARALVRPGSTREVGAIMALCCELEQPVVVRGGLTGPVGGAVAASELLAISLERMTAIEPVNSVNSCLVVEAGSTLQAAQEHAARSGQNW